MSEALLALVGVSKRYGGLIAIQDLSLDVAGRSIHGIIGPNGAGKTSLFNCITSFSKPTSGKIELVGFRIDGLPPQAIATRGIARTYQNVRLFQELTAVENVLVGQHVRLSASAVDAVLRTRRFRSEEAAAIERARELLAFVGIAEREAVLGRNLSYGDQRRLEIARALATSPTLLLLDEPAAGMNPAEARSLVGLVKDIRGRLGVTIILIEHHMHVVMAACDTVSVLDRGSLIASGTPAAIQSDERVVDAYLGKRHQRLVSSETA